MMRSAQVNAALQDLMQVTTQLTHGVSASQCLSQHWALSKCECHA